MARKKQLELADENLRLAQESLKQAKDFFDGGRMTEFEMVTKNRDVLFADFAHIAAAVEYKKAETQLLFAEGILPYLYANMTAPNSLEKRRIGVLDSANALRFFGPSGAKDGRRRQQGSGSPRSEEVTRPPSLAMQYPGLSSGEGIRVKIGLIAPVTPSGGRAPSEDVGSAVSRLRNTAEPRLFGRRPHRPGRNANALERRRSCTTGRRSFNGGSRTAIR